MNKYLGAVGAAAVSLAIGGSANAAILVNGFFEQPGGAPVRDLLTPGYLPGWSYGSIYGSSDIYESSGQDGLATVDGGNYLSFGHNGSTSGYISQSFATTAGTVYSLSYLVAQQQGQDGTQVLRATIFDGLQTLVAFDAPTGTAFAAGAGLTFTASGAYATVLFQDVTTAGFYANLALDNVSVDVKAPSGGGSAVPEPATWAMMIVGFGMVGSMSRARRTRLATA